MGRSGTVVAVPAVLRYLLDALAAYRLTRLVTADTITEPLRERIYRLADDRERFVFSDPGETAGTPITEPAPTGWRYLAEVVSCRWCAGVWVAGGVVAARRVTPRAWQPLSDVLALSAAAALLARLED